jgi:vacuolar-type H+-ATPase subunit C/Vma6
MSPSWEPLAVRARGLSTRLLGDEQLGALARAPDDRAVLRVLRESAYAPFVAAHDTAPQALDRAVGASVADRLGVLARWSDGDARPLSPIFLEEDARSVRALLRGVGGAMAPERRLAATLPTPSLDRRALKTLAGAESAGSIAATLSAWGHPYGPPLLEEASRARPDGFRLELTLARTFASAAGSAARRGGRVLGAFVRETITAWNLGNALLLAGVRTESPMEDFFIEGAGRPDLDTFVRAATADGREACVDVLAAAMQGTLFAGALAGRPTSPVQLSRAVLDARIRRLERLRRERPVSAVPVVLYVLLVRREVIRVRRSIWAASFPSHGPTRGPGGTA